MKARCVLRLAALGLALLAAGCAGAAGQEAPGPAEVYDVCQDHILEELVAPATAQFPPLENTTAN